MSRSLNRSLNRDEWPNLAELDSFTDKLAAAGDAIRRAAAGKVCGDCVHLRDGWCAKQQSINGNDLQVLYPTAVACPQHEVQP